MLWDLAELNNNLGNLDKHKALVLQVLDLGLQLDSVQLLDLDNKNHKLQCSVEICHLVNQDRLEAFSVLALVFLV